MFSDIAKECLHNHLILSLLLILLSGLLFIGIKYLSYWIRDNLGLKKEQSICLLLKKDKWEEPQLFPYVFFSYPDSIDYHPNIPEVFLFFYFEINGKKVGYEVSKELYEKATDNQSLSVTYVTTRFSQKIKVRKVSLISSTE